MSAPEPTFGEDRRQGDRRSGNTNSKQNELRRSDRRSWANGRSDRRTEKRLVGTFPAELSAEGEDGSLKEIAETVIEISVDGLKLKMFEKLSTDQRCFVRLYLPEVFVPVQATASVRWRKFDALTKQYVYGLAFEQIDHSSRALLEHFFKDVAGWGRVRNSARRIKAAFYGRFLRGLLLGSTIGDRGILKGRSDSGATFEHIYKNKPSGAHAFGKWIDKILLNLPAAKASRFRRKLVQDALLTEIMRNTKQRIPTRIVDLGSGPSSYVIDVIKNQISKSDIEAIAIDQDHESILLGRNNSDGMPIRFVKRDVFRLGHLEKLSSKLDWKPNVISISGLIYYFGDQKVMKLISKSFKFLEPDGVLVLTNMVKNPNKRLVGHLFKTQAGSQWIPLGRSSGQIKRWLSKVGFTDIRFTNDPWGMYSVFHARRPADETISSSFELPIGNEIVRGKLVSPSDPTKLRGKLIFVHGLGYTTAAYKLMFREFVRNGFSVLAFNMPGHGKSEGEWTLARAAYAIKSAIKKLNRSIEPDTPIFLMAHSTGALASLIAAADTQLVRGAVLVNLVTSVTNSYLYWHKTGFNQRVKEYFKVKGIVPAPIEKFLDDVKVMQNYRENRHLWDDLQFPYRYGLMHGHSFADFADAICFSPDACDVVARTHFPMLFVLGNNDECTDKSLSLEVFKKVTSQKEMFETDANDHFQTGKWDEIQRHALKFFEGLLK